MSPLDQACTLLADLLNDGPRNAAEILAAAEGAKIAGRTMQRAAEQMGVIKTKDGFDGGWTWALPAEDAKAESGIQEQNAAAEMFEDTNVSLRVEPEIAQVPARVDPEPSRANVIAARLRKLEAARGMKGPFYPQDTRIKAWVRAGISDPDLREAYERATTEHRGMLTAGILDNYVSAVMAEAMT
jgi:hypothetical protein